VVVRPFTPHLQTAVT